MASESEGRTKLRNVLCAVYVRLVFR